MKCFVIVVVSLMLSGCVSASTGNKLCANFNVINKVVSAVNENAGKAVAEYTPKKCLGLSINGSTENFTGGISAGVSNE